MKKLFGFLKVAGKSLFKVGKIALIGAGTAVLTQGPDVVKVISTVDPKLAAAFTLIYTLIDTWKHRDKA